MTWKEFKDTVREFLLVDSQRKGRGVQKYINQLIRSAIIDLQRYVPELRATTLESYRSHESVEDWQQGKQYEFGDIVVLRDLKVNTKYGAKTYQAISGQGTDSSVTGPTIGQSPDVNSNWAIVNILAPSEEGAHEGSFDKQFSMVDRVYVRQFPLSGTNTITKSRYYPVRQIDWDDRALILDGKTPQRTISFGDDGFVYAPQLGKDEKLIIEWRGERHFDSADYFEEGSARDTEEVVFDQREAKAVAEYTKAHLQREVDKDLNMYKSHWSQYQKERQEIYRERREHKPTSLTNPYPVSTAQVGPYQVN